MTSDAKIGLLLGLVFIFVIAFIINGLPGFSQKDDSNKLTKNMVGLQSNQPGIGAKERRVQLNLAPAAAAPAEGIVVTSDPRFVMVIPQETPAAAGSQSPEATASDFESVGSASSQLISKITSAAQMVSAQDQPAAAQDITRPALPRYYVVENGDSLSTIAKKFYGDLQGNRLVNIKAIFEVNKNTLASPDALQVGQKLVIPPLAGSNNASSPSSVLSGPAFEKVDSIGKRHLAQTSPSTKQAGIYVVQDGDSLWEIAAEKLGDGSRYKEIAKLNSDILAGEDLLEVGLKLKLPAQ